MATLYNLLLIDNEKDNASRLENALLNGIYPKKVTLYQSIDKVLNLLNSDSAHLQEQMVDIVVLKMDNDNFENSLDLIRLLKTTDTIKRIPLIVLLDKTATSKVVAVYRAHANCVIDLPESEQDLQNLVRIIENFWCNIVQLSPKIDYSYQH